MTAERAPGNGPEKTTLNISLTVEEKKFLKVYAAQSETTISNMIHSYVESLKAEKKADAK